MASKRFVHSMALPFALVLLLMLTLSVMLVIMQWYLTSAALLLLLIIVTISLFRKIEHTNLKLAGFFKMISSGESAVRFPESNQRFGTKELNTQLNQLLRKINNLEQSRQREEGLFKAIVEHLSVGVFLLDERENLYLANPIAKTFLNVRSSTDRTKLGQRAPHFFKQLPGLRQSGKMLLEVQSQGENQKWQIQRQALTQDGGSYELFLLNNLQAEMENKEGEVSEKLMHTLTHEIMNSISPITSLIDTLQLQLSGYDPGVENVIVARESFDDLQTSARIIQKRSHGLISFVERYSLLARLPRLKMESIAGTELLDELSHLMLGELTKASLQLSLHVENPQIVFRADKQMLLQVLINLVKNSAEAYAGRAGGIIIISMAKGDGYNYISVKDEAGGIPEEIRMDIFLPFFSTKDKGSGIGLSLSRKIIQAHNGRLYLKSYPAAAEFRIELPD